MHAVLVGVGDVEIPGSIEAAAMRSGEASGGGRGAISVCKLVAVPRAGAQSCSLVARVSYCIAAIGALVIIDSHFDTTTVEAEGMPPWGKKYLA